MRRRRVAAWVASGAAFLLAAFCAGAVDSPAPAENLPEGCVREIFALDSPLLKRKVDVAVLRPGEAGEKGLPVLFALHGRGDDTMYRVYSEMKPLREFVAEHPMLVVSFGAGVSGYVDATKKEGSALTSFFFDELLPEISRRYRTNGQVALTGFSMGGYGAFHYLLSRPEVFTAVSAMSGAYYLFDPAQSPGWNPVAEELLGPPADNLPAYEKLQIPLRLGEAVRSGVKLPPLLLLCGTEDFLFERNRQFADLLRSLNAEAKAKSTPERPLPPLDYEYRESPGAHDWKYWKTHSREIAEFHWRVFQGALKKE